jgi:hypothetical protein
MKFLISRTSVWEGQPCEEATLEPYTRVDERTVDDPAKLPIGNPNQQTDWWFSEGKNHRVENGHIKRDFDDQTWFVEINSLEELTEFSKKYGALVFQQPWRNSEFPSLEIYDDYRE